MNATQYMEHWTGRKVWKRLEAPPHQERLRRCASLCVGGTFIDVGCALGHSTDHMARFRPGVWAGMDFDQGAIELARSKFQAIPFFYAPDYDMLKAADGRRFDSVVSSEVIEHVEDERGFVAGLSALARHRVILTTPNRPVDDPGHLRCYTRETLAALLSGRRFDIQSAGRFFYVTIDTEGGEP